MSEIMSLYSISLLCLFRELWPCTEISPRRSVALVLLYGLNPHIPMGCDNLKVRMILKDIKFQSTHPYGMWRCLLECLPRGFIGFNPHIPMGCDLFHAFSYSVYRWVSIHTSLWDVTSLMRTVSSSRRRFNPHIPMGCDVYRLGDVGGIPGFNPHIPMGCDPSR